jgi:DedD protein
MDSALKQRLLGAAVLIALAIIFVPMFLSNTPPKQDNSTQNLNIPPAPERNFETRNLAVETPSGAAPSPQPFAPPPSASVPAAASSASGSSKVADSNRLATVTTGAPPTFEAPDTTAGAKPATSPSAAATSKPAVAAPTPPPAPSAETDGRFLVNLGVYADAGHANALVDKVKKLGYPAFAETTDFQGKPAQRVRVGPYADRGAAESVRLKIKQADAKVPSSIVEAADATPVTPTSAPAAFKPTAAAAPAPAAAPAAPAPNLPANRAGGYAVQLGAFKSEAEANKLRDRLRAGGVASFIDKSGDGDQALWKVRAGPYADRGGADSALATIKQKFQITGLVKTLP